MSRRMNWEQLRLARKRKFSVKDEQEFIEQDLASKWLRHHDPGLKVQAHHAAKPKVQRRKALTPARRNKRTRYVDSIDQIDPRDPFSQAYGVDTRKPPF